jgi:hypothetical protein
VCTTEIEVLAINDAPSIDLNVAEPTKLLQVVAGVDQLAIAPNVTIEDVDSATMLKAEVTITTGFIKYTILTTTVLTIHYTP